MILAGAFLCFAGWVWSVINGFRVGLLCGTLNFFFFPLSQFIFSLYEPKIRKPLLFMVIGMGLMTWGLARIGWDFYAVPATVPGGVFT